MRHSLLAAFTVLLLPALGLAQNTSTSPSSAPSSSGAPSEAALMAEGTRAFNNGDMNGAAEYFIQVAQTDPHNMLALQYLRKIRAALLIQKAKPSGLDTLVLPKVNLNQATFSSALDFLKNQAAQQNTTVSFVPQLPAAQLQATVTLNLTQIPFLDALHYVCQLNNATYKVEPFAIVITPAAPGGATATQ